MAAPLLTGWTRGADVGTNLIDGHGMELPWIIIGTNLIDGHCC